jgi:hypothetical protein
MSPSPDRTVRLWLAALAIACAFHGCMTGSEIPNELKGSLVAVGGAVESGAKVSVFRSDLIPRMDSNSVPVASTRTDSAGRYRIADLPPGSYTLMAEKSGTRAFRDSLVITKSGFEAGPDTLKSPGALSGRVRLEPPDNPRMALVQVIGTDIYVNVDSTGRFDLTDMADGKYRIRVFVSSPDYVPEFRVVRIQSGRMDTLPETIAPFYIGNPRVSGLKAEALTDGSIRLTWHKSTSSAPFTCAVFREATDSYFDSGNALRYDLTDSVYIDTVYSRTPRPDPLGFDPVRNAGIYGGQYPYEDTTAYAFRYHIVVFGEATSATEFARVVAIPPLAGKGSSPAAP